MENGGWRMEDGEWRMEGGMSPPSVFLPVPGHEVRSFLPERH
jgi:hypothetical protein